MTLLIPHKPFFLVDTLGFVDRGDWTALKTHTQETLRRINVSPQAEVVVGRKDGLVESLVFGGRGW